MDVQKGGEGCAMRWERQVFSQLGSAGLVARPSERVRGSLRLGRGCQPRPLAQKWPMPRPLKSARCQCSTGPLRPRTNCQRQRHAGPTARAHDAPAVSSRRTALRRCDFGFSQLFATLSARPKSQVAGPIPDTWAGSQRRTDRSASSARRSPSAYAAKPAHRSKCPDLGLSVSRNCHSHHLLFDSHRIFRYLAGQPRRRPATP